MPGIKVSHLSGDEEGQKSLGFRKKKESVAGDHQSIALPASPCPDFVTRVDSVVLYGNHIYASSFIS